MAAARNKHGLTAKQERFAVAYACRGMTKSDAYRLAYNTNKMEDKTVYEAACRLSKDSKMIARINVLLDEMQVEDIVSGQQILRMMLDDRELARESGLPGVAVQAGDRLMRHKALLTDRVVSSREGAGLDEDIVKTLARGDARKERMLRQIIGSDDAFAPLESVDDTDSTDTVLTGPDKKVVNAK
jgi:hypothetical protein